MRHEGRTVLLDSEGHDPQESGQVPQLLLGQGREQCGLGLPLVVDHRRPRCGPLGSQTDEKAAAILRCVLASDQARQLQSVEAVGEGGGVDAESLSEIGAMR